MIKHYSKGIQNEIQRLLFNANSSIKIAVAWFTNELLFIPLVMKLKLGIDVEIVLNQDEINTSKDNLIDFDSFVNSGGKLHWNCTGQLMHDKFCIIDNSIVVSGSYNWTNKAEYNDESIAVFIDEETTVSFFRDSFDRLCEKYPVSPMKIKLSNTDPEKEAIPVSTLAKNEVQKPIVSKAIISGRCGEDLSFTLLENGTLAFWGAGPIPDYDTLEARPWHSYQNKVQLVRGQSGIKGIGRRAFEGLSNLESFNVVVSGTIGDFAFRNCTRLRYVSHRNVELIGHSAFEGCVSLKRPLSARLIGDNAFKDCRSFVEVSAIDEWEIIGKYAFSGCSGLSTILLGFDLKVIEDNAFENCIALSSVCFSRSTELEHLGKDVFHNCPSLEEIVIPNGVFCDGAPLSIDGFPKEIVRPDKVHPLIETRHGFPIDYNLKEGRLGTTVRVQLDAIPNDLSKSASAYSVHMGDTIKVENSEKDVLGNIVLNPFSDRIGPFVVKHMSVVRGDSYYIAVTRNNKPSWLNLKYLVQCDAFREPVGAFQRQMLSFSTWQERLHFIYGKTIKGGTFEIRQMSLKNGLIKACFVAPIEFV